MSDRIAEADDQADPREHPEEIENHEAPQAHPSPARSRVHEHPEGTGRYGANATASPPKRPGLRRRSGAPNSPPSGGRRPTWPPPSDPHNRPAHQKNGVAKSSVGSGARTASTIDASPTRANAPPDAIADVDPRSASRSTGIETEQRGRERQKREGEGASGARCPSRTRSRRDAARGCRAGPHHRTGQCRRHLPPVASSTAGRRPTDRLGGSRVQSIRMHCATGPSPAEPPRSAPQSAGESPPGRPDRRPSR